MKCLFMPVAFVVGWVLGADFIGGTVILVSHSAFGTPNVVYDDWQWWVFYGSACSGGALGALGCIALESNDAS